MERSVGIENLNFFSAEQSLRMVDVCEKVSKFIHENDIKTLILVDRSARLAYIGINQILEKKFSDTPKPKVFFINPKSLVFCEERNACLKKISKEEQILIFDTCIHTGNNMRPVIDFFENEGFKNIKIGVASNARNNSGIKPDLICDFNKGCYPFSNFDSYAFQSWPNQSFVEPKRPCREKIVKIRKEVRQVFKELVASS